MTEIEPTSPDRPIVNTGAPGNDMVLPLIAWITYLIGWGLIGLIMAYIDRGKAPPTIRDNYTYMIRTFWIGLLYVLAMFSLWMVFVLIFSATPNPNMVVIGAGVYAVPAAIGLWFVVRCIKGIISLVRGQPIRNTRTWFV